MRNRRREIFGELCLKRTEIFDMMLRQEGICIDKSFFAISMRGLRMNVLTK